MNKRPDDPNKHGEVATIDGPQLPAVIKKTKNPWKKFSVLDRLAEDIRDSTTRLDRRTLGDTAAKARRDGVAWEYWLIDDDDRQKLARCRELIEQLDGPENYEPADDDTDDDEPILKKSVISATPRRDDGGACISADQKRKSKRLLPKYCLPMSTMRKSHGSS